MTHTNQDPAPSRQSRISLREVTGDTVREIIRLKVNPEQTRFVADNATSIAEAYFEKMAYFRAIYADETPVGFVMLHDNPEEGQYFLWRFMIDGRYQGLGFGRQALNLLIDYVRSRPNATELVSSYVPGDGCPMPFYAQLGFVETGEVESGENMIRLAL